MIGDRNPLLGVYALKMNAYEVLTSSGFFCFER
jgi:hypothetical protein